MSTPGDSAVRWLPREVPLLPVAAAGLGPVARALALRLLQRDAESLAKLTAVANPDLLLVLGTSDELPWVDGISYLGRDPSAPLLLLPTQLAPSVPPVLLQAALLKQAASAGPLAVLPGSHLLVPIDGARSLAKSALLQWSARERTAA